jgi:predicted thioesterase
MERRRNHRLRRRLRLLFHDGKQERVGFTRDVSATGLSLVSTIVLLPGTRMRIQLTLRSGQEVDIEAEVRWARKVPAGLGVNAQNSMGVHFLTPPGALWATFLADSHGTGSQPPGASPVFATPYPAGSTAAGGLEVAAAPVPLAPGLAGRFEATVTAEDLAAPGELYACGPTLARVAAWIERAAARALIGRLPPSSTSVGVGLQLNLHAAFETPIGTRVFANATLTEVGATGKTLTFVVTLFAGNQEIGTGTHIRSVAQPRK